MNPNELVARARSAAVELRALRTRDPLAASAMDAIRLTVRTLEQWWLPTLDELCGRACDW